MKGSSLRVRVLVGVLIWICVALVAGGYAVVEVFKASALRQFDDRLEQELTLLSVAVATVPEAPSRRMTSPAFSRVYSGLYWQARQGDVVLRSRSLFDFALPVPDAAGLTRGETKGPDGQTLRVLSQQLTAPDGTAWRLAVASDLATLEEETALFSRGLLPAAGWLALALIVAAVLVLRSAFLPLQRLREAVSDLRTDDDSSIPQTFPTEVAPLVDDLNAMLEKNSRLRARGRAQAANLAHALKTPAAVLQNEIDRVRTGGALDLSLAEDAVAQITAAARRHDSGSGARPGDLPEGEVFDAVPLLNGVVRAIERLFPELGIETKLPDALDLNMAPPDQQEIFGNLMENAGKWAHGQIRVTLSAAPGAVLFVVEDDGPGVPEDARMSILDQGVRLDETKSGSGLGLAIVSEIVERHDGVLTLGESSIGGLKIQIELPCPEAS